MAVVPKREERLVLDARGNSGTFNEGRVTE